MDMLRARDVHFDYTYENEAPQVVLRGVDLAVEKGSFVAVLGHNGCGKSTLAKHFNALLLPTGGQVLVAELDTAVAISLFVAWMILAIPGKPC